MTKCNTSVKSKYQSLLRISKTISKLIILKFLGFLFIVHDRKNLKVKLNINFKEIEGIYYYNFRASCMSELDSISFLKLHSTIK